MKNTKNTTYSTNGFKSREASKKNYHIIKNEELLNDFINYNSLESKRQMRKYSINNNIINISNKKKINEKFIKRNNSYKESNIIKNGIKLEKSIKKSKIIIIV